MKGKIKYLYYAKKLIVTIQCLITKMKIKVEKTFKDFADKINFCEKIKKGDIDHRSRKIKGK